MTSKEVIVLASQSKARRRLLKRLGLSFVVKPSKVDESVVLSRLKNPRRLVRELSLLKARSVAASMAKRHPGAVVIGSDQVLVCSGRIFGKPGTEARARAQLRHFSGSRISLMTAFSVVQGAKSRSFVHETKMKFRVLSRKEISAYVRKDRPMECAGSFKFESFGVGLFDSIQTDDPTAIEGLPLIQLSKVLREFGVSGLE